MARKRRLRWKDLFWVSTRVMELTYLWPAAKDEFKRVADENQDGPAMEVWMILDEIYRRVVRRR